MKRNEVYSQVLWKAQHHSYHLNNALYRNTEGEAETARAVNITLHSKETGVDFIVSDEFPADSNRKVSVRAEVKP